jgi:prophage DNA circulation protein
MANEDGIFGQYPVAAWAAGSMPKILFPVVDITETGGNRIVPHERPYRDGAKLDDTGSKARTWAVTILFNNAIVEPGIASDPRRPLYPTVLRQLLRSFDIHETGTLTLPTIGDVRARVETYTRAEKPEQFDSAAVTVNWIEDNEEALDRAALQPPGVVATLVRLSERTVFTAQALGVWSSDLATLRERCNELTTAMQAPGRAVADVATVARANRRAIESVFATGRTELGRLGLFSEPRSSELHDQLATLSDRQARAEDERTASRPRTMAWVVDVEQTSIYEIAARVRQDAEELLDLNAARISDPFDIERGTVLRIFETAA